MSKGSGSHKHSKSSTAARQSKQAAAKHAASKRTKTHGRAHKSRLAEVTAELNGQLAQVHDLYTVKRSNASNAFSRLPDDSMQTLAEVMRGL